ncbi:MAG: hypothetical protein JW990_18990 [Thermoleophilia bacterium]|nr:hypothetical protein [Thermoleophilia bacterium]
MVRWWLLIVLLPLLALFAFCGCEPASPEEALPEPEEAISESATAHGADVSRETASMPAGKPAGDPAGWPGNIPDDIPPLHGGIRNVMEGGTHIRIFYQGLSRDQLDDYLGLLEDNGFRLEYVVYEDERLPDEVAEKRFTEGDFDAVDITKGPYHLNMGYGEGDIVLDVYTSGWEDDYPLTPVRDWPADLTDVPVPEDCRIEAVYAQDDGGHQIVCRPEDEQAVADYHHALQAAGYLPTNQPRVAHAPVGSDYPDVLARGDTEVTLDYSTSISTFRLTIWRAATFEAPTQTSRPGIAPARPTTSSSTTVTWPSELVGMVPQPQGLTIHAVQEVGELDFMIVCIGADNALVLDYAALLRTEGFMETNRMEAEQGRVIALAFANGSLVIDLLPGVDGTLVIRIMRKPAGRGPG